MTEDKVKSVSVTEVMSSEPSRQNQYSAGNIADADQHIYETGYHPPKPGNNARSRSRNYIDDIKDSAVNYAEDIKAFIEERVLAMFYDGVLDKNPDVAKLHQLSEQQEDIIRTLESIGGATAKTSNLDGKVTPQPAKMPKQAMGEVHVINNASNFSYHDQYA